MANWEIPKGQPDRGPSSLLPEEKYPPVVVVSGGTVEIGDDGVKRFIPKESTLIGEAAIEELRIRAGIDKVFRNLGCQPPFEFENLNLEDID